MSPMQFNVPNIHINVLLNAQENQVFASDMAFCWWFKLTTILIYVWSQKISNLLFRWYMQQKQFNKYLATFFLLVAICKHRGYLEAAVRCSAASWGLSIFSHIVCHTMRVMRWCGRRPSKLIRQRDALKRVGARGAINCRPSSSLTTVCTEAWSTESHHKLRWRGPSRPRPPCSLYTMAVRLQCDFFSQCDFLQGGELALL